MSTPSDKTLRLERTKLTPQPPRGGRNTTLIVAVIAGVAAAILAGIWLRGQQGQQPTVVQQTPQQAPPPPVTSPVVVTTQDIPAQTVITPAMVSQSQVAAADVKPGAIPNAAVIVGTYTTMKPLKKGDQIINGDVLPNQPQFAGVSSMLKPGERAMTIALDSNSSVAGFLKPGDHVDVIGTFSVGTRTVTRTVLQNVELIATGAQVEWEKQDPTAQNQNQGVLASNNNDPNAPQPKPAAPQEIPNATVRVKPLDAEKLILAGSRGKLMLVLRGNTDNTQTVVPLVDATAVTTLREPGSGGGGNVAPPPPPPMPIAQQLPQMRPTPPMPIQPPTPTITVVRGSQPTTVTVQAN